MSQCGTLLGGWKFTNLKNGDMAAAEEWLRAKRKGKTDTRTETDFTARTTNSSR